MGIKRSIEISVEKTRRFVIRQPETDATILCPACNEPMLAAEAAAILFRVKCRLVYRIVETGAAHYLETESGALFVCPQRSTPQSKILTMRRPLKSSNCWWLRRRKIRWEQSKFKKNYYETKNIFKKRDCGGVRRIRFLSRRAGVER